MFLSMGRKQNRRGEHSILVRMPLSLHDRLKAKADAERRSVNAQVLVLLEENLPTKEAA